MATLEFGLIGEGVKTTVEGLTIKAAATLAAGLTDVVCSRNTGVLLRQDSEFFIVSQNRPLAGWKNATHWVEVIY